jgi:TonB-dependent receptor
VRGDARFWQDRITVVGGVRLEETDIEGTGPLDDINAQYQRNPDGSFVRNAAGARVLVTNDALALRQLRYKERGASTQSKYHDYYPSINTSYRVSDHFVARAAYARTIGRPNVNFLIPGTTISDPDVTTPTITVNNPALRPWTADNYDLTFEVYDIKRGSGAVGFFQKDVRDFFGAVQTPVTDDLLDQQGLPTDGTYDGYQFRTMENAGKARVRGVELSYRQQLFFLPGLLKSFQLNANVTKLRLNGGRLADFSGFVPLSFSTGLNFIRPRYLVKFTYVYQDGFATSAVAASATELPGTFNYQNKYKRYGVEAEYSLHKHCTLFLGATDLGRRSWVTLRYAPETPDYARYTRRQSNGYYIVTGLKGRF